MNNDDCSSTDLLPPRGREARSTALRHLRPGPAMVRTTLSQITLISRTRDREPARTNLAPGFYIFTWPLWSSRSCRLLPATARSSTPPRRAGVQRVFRLLLLPPGLDLRVLRAEPAILYAVSYFAYAFGPPAGRDSTTTRASMGGRSGSHALLVSNLRSLSHFLRTSPTAVR